VRVRSFGSHKRCPLTNSASFFFFVLITHIGIPYKTGTFSSHEDELIRQTIKDYVARNNMPEDAIQRWFENGNGRGRFEKNDLKALWVEIGKQVDMA